ncbi:MAG: hypothetical protein ISS47_08000 [Candidatus Omnitrophica bacterium]|nr:hypothetical protein [Candidatus Omnitrophota bacterium]
MKTSKIVTLIFIFILFAFLHIFLQTEIIKLGYEVKKNEDSFQELIDNNHILKYNIYVLESPYSLDRHVLVKNSNLKVLKPVQVLGLYSESDIGYLERDKRNNPLLKNPVFLALRKFFTGKQAEAKTIK